MVPAAGYSSTAAVYSCAAYSACARMCARGMSAYPRPRPADTMARWYPGIVDAAAAPLFESEG